MKTPRYLAGIDLGTTNSAMACCELGAGRGIQMFPVPQLVNPGEIVERFTFPSALYMAGEHDVPAGALALPWEPDTRTVSGYLAQKLGTRVAGRLVSSAKSWLCHEGVDRRAAILPWGGMDEERKISPVSASARFLKHLRSAWNSSHPEAPLEEQQIILTVPASFDEIARELTVEAARDAGLSNIRLVEEPQAALYAWLHKNPDWRKVLAECQLILVIDVGGGTTDFSLIAVKKTEAGVLDLARVAVGDHLLLGGDNMDLALARLIEAREGKAAGLDAARWAQLTALCREAKEKLLGEDELPAVSISLPGRGRSVIGGAVSATLTQEDVRATVLEGCFPRRERDARPRPARGLGLAEFGLPYVAEPEIPRHLAAFLDGAGKDLPAPDAVLFNGGALKPRVIRNRMLDILTDWFGARPLELEGSDLDLAVAYGATAYALALRGEADRITSGAARSYYAGVAGGSETSGLVKLLCIAPRGMSEGETVEIQHPEFEVLANTPVRFPIYASTTRHGDKEGTLIDAAPQTVAELPPIQTVLRFGRSLSERSIPVHLEARLTEIGTLELWCLSRKTEHRWRLNFDLRARSREHPDSSPNRIEEASEIKSAPPLQELSNSPAQLEAAMTIIEGCFGPGHQIEPTALPKLLADALGAGKDAWPLETIRALWEPVFTLEAARKVNQDLEARWLNLTGFLLRPGFGHPKDRWRCERLWRLFQNGVFFTQSSQVKAEWWNLWKRAAAGLSRTQQNILFNSIKNVLLPHLVKRARDKAKSPGPQELREMWQLAGSLELLAAETKRDLAEMLAPRVSKGKATDAEIWAFGRLTARVPVYGPANTVVPPEAVGAWVKLILVTHWERPAAMALAIAQAARFSGDRVRDLSVELREEAARRLEKEPEGKRLAPMVRELVDFAENDRARIFAESLPVGLRLSPEAQLG